jgi:hypothetical protein
MDLLVAATILLFGLAYVLIEIWSRHETHRDRPS